MSLLSKISKGKRPAALRMLIHGPPGVGKSTFASGSGGLFFDIEHRTDHLDVARIVPTSWTEFMADLTELRNLIRDGKSDVRWVVVDTLDALEAHIHKAVCDEAKVKTIEEFSWGKGYVAALGQWARFVSAIDAFRLLGVSFILIAHSQVRIVRNPGQDDFECWGIALKSSKNANPTDLFRARMDAIGFAHWEDFTKKDVKEQRVAKAITSGERLLTFEHNPSFETKRGIDLPGEIPLSWSEFQKALTKENA